MRLLFDQNLSPRLKEALEDVQKVYRIRVEATLGKRLES